LKEGLGCWRAWEDVKSGGDGKKKKTETRRGLRNCDYLEVRI
jgi:hypothetical protein